MKHNKTLKKLDNYSVPYLYLIITICTVIGYIVRYASPELYVNLLLIPHKVVLDHQFWRLFTWIFTNPYELSGAMIVFMPINLFFYYSLGRRLELYWGRFMYNLYIFGGMLLINLVVLIGGYYRYVWSVNADKNIQRDILTYEGLSASTMITKCMLISIFLAFTVVGGDGIVYLYFIIPLKMKWLGYIDLILLAVLFVSGGFFTKLIVISSVANFFIYYLLNKSKTGPDLNTLKRRREFERAKKRPSKTVEYNADGTIKFKSKDGIIPPGYGNPEGITIHKCAVCGLTEKDNPHIEFRFCSKCNGNYEYCSNHLYTHQHIN